MMNFSKGLSAEKLLGFNVFAALACILFFDKIWAWFLVALFVWGLFELLTGRLEKLSKADLIFILCFATFPVFCLLQMLVFDNVSFREFDIPSRFLLLIPVYFLLKKYVISWNYLISGACLGGALAMALAVYQTKVIGLDRASGYDSAITFGQIAMMLFSVSIMAIRPNIKNILYKIFLAVISSMSLVAVMLSASRGALLGIFMITLLCFLWRKHSISLMFVCTSILIGVLFSLALHSDRIISRVQVISPEISSFFNDEKNDTSTGSRLRMWNASLLLVKDKPILGYGRGNYKVAMNDLGITNPAFSRKEAIFKYSHAHNDYLNLLVESGVVGFIFFIGPLLLLLFLVLASSSSSQTKYCMVMVVLIWAVFGLTQTQLSHHKITLLQAFLITFAFSRYKSPSTN